MSQSINAFRPVGGLARTVLLLKSVVINTGYGFILRRRRHRDQVKSDYDQGEWSAHLRNERWTKVPTLTDYLVPEGQREMTVLRDGTISKATVEDYYKFRIEKLIELVSANDGGAREIVELGSGSGRNIFSLATAGRWKLRGFELSSVGLKVSEAVRERYGVKDVEFGFIDLLSDDVASMPELHDATVFTYLCLEQLPGHGEAILRRLINAGVKRGIHVEPSLELFKSTRLRDLATIAYIRRQDYQRTLITAARKLEQEGLLRILKAERADYAPTIRNEPTLLVWERGGG